MYLESRLNGAKRSISMRGNFGYDDHPKIRRMLSEIADAGPECWEIRLDELDYIDTAGIAMLLLIIEECEKSNARLRISTRDGFVRKVLELAGLESRLDKP